MQTTSFQDVEYFSQAFLYAVDTIKSEERVHIDEFEYFDVTTIEPIPFYSTQESFQYEPVTLECAQDFLLDTLKHDDDIVIKDETPLYNGLKLPVNEIKGMCFSNGCDKTISYRGFCKDHGGIRLCSVEKCPKGNQGKRMCISHGGGKRCRVNECEKSAQSHGLCKAHGGGARCTVPSCDKSSQGGGLCRKHGGGRRCSVPDCTSGAQRANLCARHGGSRLCSVKDCGRTDRGGGLCENHRKDLVCREIGCNRLAMQESTDKLCLRHSRRQNDTIAL